MNQRLIFLIWYLVIKRFRLAGAINSNGSVSPFSLTADMIKGYQSKLNKVSIIPTTYSGDYELLHASYSSSAVAETLSTMNIQLAGKPVLSLYFKNKNSREVALFDIDLSSYDDLKKNLLEKKKSVDLSREEDKKILKQDLKDIKDEKAKKDEFELNQARDNEYWTGKLFEPLQTSPDLDSEVSTMGATVCYKVVGCKDTSYSYVHEYTGSQVGQVFNEVIEWNFKNERFAPTSFLGNITITKTYTDSTWDGYDDPTFAPLTLGHYDNDAYQLKMKLTFDGSNNSTSPWGDTISKVRIYGSTTAENYPTSLVKQFVKKGRNWVNALYDTVAYLLAANSSAEFNGPDKVMYGTDAEAIKGYSMQLQDRRMGTPGQSLSTEVYLTYRSDYNGNYSRLFIYTGVYRKDGWGFYNSLVGTKDIYYDLWYSY